MKIGRKFIFTEICRASASLLKIGIGGVGTFLSSACFKREASAHARVVAKFHVLEGRTFG